jgi:hypothetical protein
VKAWTVVGTTHDADMCCVECCEYQHFHSTAIFDLWSEGKVEVPDGEGNPIHPVFSSDAGDDDVCSVCGRRLLS